ncbi:hypothetical protein AVEN_138733-1 [Araneus ventricosus]|uniref:Uncharacterized protein n=1 Tax=Araneus ventricosus TaxID=182803 RepID=A0A4Y2MGI5_ARAVE|nr:hypothetical protein AVEN_3209-1 [Araneus ventricosus]GBN24857.1 hypothetical protein AVEN_256995-1 [Araneus ventricosus]GBN24938.1 hypothetical protein AVEN_124691-1 [Araneus ventricosus]GBN24944.1 hypothetical protein AVEN_138733-1 [Araneus ventricosus]
MTTFHECVTVTLGYHKLGVRWVSKMLTEEHKKKRMGFAIDFLTRYAETGDEFLNHIITDGPFTLRLQLIPLPEVTFCRAKLPQR